MEASFSIPQLFSKLLKAVKLSLFGFFVQFAGSLIHHARKAEKLII